MGNPTKYEPALFAAILERLSNGEPLAAICRDIGIARDTVRSWCREDKALDKRFKEARLLGADAIAEDCLKIADDSSLDYIPDKEGNPGFNSEHVQRSKLRVDTRLKLLAKWFPQQYGDKLHTENHNVSMTHEEWLANLK